MSRHTKQVIDVEGSKFRVLLGTSPEEVEVWRAERRKRWPTDANKARFVLLPPWPAASKASFAFVFGRLRAMYRSTSL